MTLYRPPVTCLSAVIAGSGGCALRIVRSGSSSPHLRQRAADPRFHDPQSVQNNFSHRIACVQNH
ncbi:MAG: hypothetical protein ABJC63_05785, partial [Gemmatimonadales bacterium]